ncbi:TPA: adhesive domain-containing protein [Enterococcus faecalis]
MLGSSVGIDFIAINSQCETAEAVTLSEVQLLTDTNVTANLSESDSDNYYNLNLGLTGKGVADVELVNPNKKVIFYAPELVGKLTKVGSANVSVEILPITMDKLPILNNAIGGVTSGLTNAVSKVLNVVDQLQSSLIPKSLLEIKGIDELNQAVSSLNNINQALADLLKYEDSVDYTLNQDGTIVVNFSNGLTDHLRTAINDVVIKTLENVITAIQGVSIKILPEAENILGLGVIVRGLNNTINLAVGGLTSIAAQITGVINNISNGTLDITSELGKIQLLGKTSVNLNVLVNRPVGITGDVKIQGAGVQNSIIDLALLSSLESFAIIHFPEESKGFLGIAYQPENFDFGVIKLNSQAPNNVYTTQFNNKEYHVGVVDKTKTKINWALKAKLAGNELLQQGISLGIGNGTGEVKINKGNGSSWNFVDSPKDIVFGERQIIVDENESVVMKGVSGSFNNDTYDYRLGNIVFTIKNVDRVQAGTYNGQIVWNLEVAP